jgi:hypothetical protein
MIATDYPLRAVLALAGLAIVVLGLNVGLGGITTLGWQGGGTGFVAVVDAARYAIHDNHVRFIGGVWLAVGLLMSTGSIAFRQLRPALVALTAMIFVGGLARLSDVAALANWAVAPSLLLELVGFPLLGWWVWHAERQTAAR